MAVTRRYFGLGLGVSMAAAALTRGARAGSGPERRFAEIEAASGGRLGVGILDTLSGRVTGHRGDERFPMCSTHKALSAAAILARVDRGEERLDRRLRFSPDAVLPYSPGTQAHAGEEGMTIAAICEAAMTLSDNTAANLMLGAIGGPAGLTDFLRRHGDDVTRLDRTEPSLNEALPGDPRDTTSPFAMAATLDRLVLGDVLAPASRETLIAWLVAGKTGGARLRAGVPQDWRVGEKTGTGDNGTANDIGLFWPPQRKSPHGNNRFMWRPFPARWRLLQRSGYFRGSPKPVIVTAFLTGSTASREAQSAAIADVARTVVAMLQA